VLLNVFQTRPGDPLVSGYAHTTADLTALVNAHVGTSLRLRFAEVDNVDIFQMGVDNADITIGSAGSVPEPTYAGLLAATMLIGILARRKATTR
jgi:hypothetical protein